MIKKENDSIVYEKVIPAHGAEYVSFPESMRPEIGDYLRSQGISRLYSHQAEMFIFIHIFITYITFIVFIINIISTALTTDSLISAHLFIASLFYPLV